LRGEENSLMHTGDITEVNIEVLFVVYLSLSPKT